MNTQRGGELQKMELYVLVCKSEDRKCAPWPHTRGASICWQVGVDAAFIAGFAPTKKKIK